MRIGVFIPIKSNSTRVPNKNFEIIGGIPLFERTFKLTSNIVVPCGSVIDFYVDSDSDIVLESAINYNITPIRRLPELTLDSATGDDLLKYHSEKFPQYDIYCQLYITCPFQTSTNISDVIDPVVSGNYDSSFLVREHHTWFWYNGKPINYTPGQLVRSQDCIPVLSETTGFYAITKSALEKTKCRIGESPFMLPVNYIEAIDIDTLEDLQLAKTIADAKL
jgi:CMP-N-acetylneuraminic acid synthetase